MSREPEYKTVKIVKVFCLYHPDFKTHKDGTYELLPTGKWVVEWNIRHHNELSVDHYTKSFEIQAEAEAFAEKLLERHGEDTPWVIVTKQDEIFQGKKRRLLGNILNII